MGSTITLPILAITPRLFSLLVLSCIVGLACPKPERRDLLGSSSQRDSSVEDAILADRQPTDLGQTDAHFSNVKRPADILFVIDNSGSMREEQEKLALSASSSCTWCTSTLCDSSGFRQLQAWFADHRHVPLDDWGQFQVGSTTALQVYEDCGFIERLQLLGNDFQIGVITTDMNDCDTPTSGSLRGSVPQRGCLQTSAQDPTTTVLHRSLSVLPDKFYNIVTNVSTYGSAYEKGLAAAKHFLTDGSDTANSNNCDLPRSCANDFQHFYRTTAMNYAGDEVATQLVVIFLTDEDDCSHDGSLSEDHNTLACYESPELLIGPSQYISFFRSLKTHPELTSMGLLAGLFDSGNGLRAAGCKECTTAEDVANFGCSIGSPTGTCDPAQGNSIATCTLCTPGGEPICRCHPEIPADSCGGQSHAATNCCQSDPANRYYQVVSGMAEYKMATLCQDSYKSALIELANFINRVDR